jgi:enoyl-CoA hydratase/carnithine racemase
MELKATRYDVRDRIATITLHRPERLNAWTGRMHTEYRWLLAQADADADVGAIVVTGAGRGFCAGGDAKALEGHVDKGGYDPGTPEDLAEPGRGVRPEFDAAFAYHMGLAKPVVAAINGPAAGVGFALACWADLRFAAAGAKMTTAHGPLALPAEYGLSWLLPRLVGLTRANDLLLSSRKFLAEEAEAMGLVNAVVPGDELLDHVHAYLTDLLARNAPSSLAATRHQIYTDLHRSAAEAVRDSEARLESMMRSADFAEGVAALVEKRAPRWPRGE